MRYVAIGCCLITLIACKRERRDVRPSPAFSGILGDTAGESALRPGGGAATQKVSNPYEGNAYAISEGQRLFSWYNCSGCHANGGGGIGPPLIKKDQRDWIYGADPSNIFDTIVKGRPNGMPTWGGKIPEYQIWQIVTYVRSLNNLARSSTSNRRGRGGRRLVDVQSKYKYCGSTAESNLDIATGVLPAKTGGHPALSDPALVVGSITLYGYIAGS